MESGRLPFLLATPTWHTGALDAAELVERLRVYRESGAVPGPADFAQALLRVRRCGGPEGDGYAAAAEALGTAEGDRLAAWLRADEPVAPVLRHPATAVSRPSAANWWQRSATGARQVLLATRERAVIRRDFPPGVPLAGPGAAPPGPAVLPLGPGALLALDGDVARGPGDAGRLAAAGSAVRRRRGAAGSRRLPWPLAESTGVTGGATHLALAYALGARHQEDRTAAVDALLVLVKPGPAGRGAAGAGVGDPGRPRPGEGEPDGGRARHGGRHRRPPDGAGRAGGDAARPAGVREDAPGARGPAVRGGSIAPSAAGPGGSGR